FTKALFRIFFLVLLSGVLLGLPAAGVTAAANRPLNLQFVGAGAEGPPDVVVLSDGTVIFKVTVFEAITGDLSGTLTEKITQVYPLSEEDGLLPITTAWKLETTEGTIEGYYSGEFQHMRDGDHFITQHGEVLSVTGEYVNLYQARVSYQAVLGPDHMTVSGTVNIYPRGK
ncbi:MAG TPA: hypothetical protein VLR92_05050, partial [Blastocatellia bacterium]|nr:hypothetical protein [Blastocatellia bacterium]